MRFHLHYLCSSLLILLCEGNSFCFVIIKRSLLAINTTLISNTTLSSKITTIRPCHKAAILPRRTKKALFTTLSLIPMVSIARLSVVKQSSFGLPGQYGRRVTRVNGSSWYAEREWTLVTGTFGNDRPATNVVLISSALVKARLITEVSTVTRSSQPLN